MQLTRTLFALSFAALAPACATDGDPGSPSDPSGPGGPPGSVASVCPPTTTLFEHAVCACDDLGDVGALQVLAGPAGVGSVGVNGRSVLASFAEVSGTWYAWGGFSGAGATIGDALVTPADVSFAGDVRIAGDVTIGGDLTCTGRLEIDGALALGGSKRVLGLESINQRATYAAPTAPPCDCNPATFFDVEAAVASAKQVTGGHSSWAHLGLTDIHLASGNYYVTAADVVGRTQIFVDGAVSVFVDGSLDEVGATRWKLGPNATLDLFVSGNVISVGLLAAGNPSDPTAFRLYVGGDGKVGVATAGYSKFYGSLYAPRSIVSYSGDAHVVGAIFARTILGGGLLSIAYGASTQPPTSCTPPPGGDASSTPVFY